MATLKKIYVLTEIALLASAPLAPPPPPLLLSTDEEQGLPWQTTSTVHGLNSDFKQRSPWSPKDAPQALHDGLLYVWDDALSPKLCAEINDIFRSFSWRFDKKATLDARGGTRSFRYARGELANIYRGGGTGLVQGKTDEGQCRADQNSGQCTGLDIDQPALLAMWQEINKRMQTSGILEKGRQKHFRLARIYANGLSVGLDATPHYDDGDISFMYYAIGERDEWRVEHGGETIFLNDARDMILGGVLPRANRIIAFDTALLHYGKAPTDLYRGGELGRLRITLILKALTTPPQNATCANDTNKHCGFWATVGECEANPTFMRNACASSCQGLCTVLDEVPRYRWPQLKVHPTEPRLESENLFRVFDAAFPPEFAVQLDAVLHDSFPWQFGHVTQNGSDAFFAAAAVLQAQPAISELKRKIQAIVSHPGFPKKGLKVTRMHAFGQNTGMDMWRPNYDTGNEYTFLYYVLRPGEQWLVEHGGETSFFNRASDAVLLGVLPRFNRLVGWDTPALPMHMERGPSWLYPNQLRRTLVISVAKRGAKRAKPRS